jgi:hypothetical protein
MSYVPQLPILQPHGKIPEKAPTLGLEKQGLLGILTLPSSPVWLLVN